jgi:hypothetical protein
MLLDELVLGLQHLVDRAVRRVRLGPAPLPRGRRLLVVQIDGLPRSVLEQSLREGRMPFLDRLMRRAGHRLHGMNVGLPSSTPAFQMAAMYGVRPDIPGFHYHDKRRRADVYFPRAGDAAWVEQTQADGRPGILDGGSAYGCVFTGGAANNLFTFTVMKRPTGAGLLRVVSAFLVLGWVSVKSLVLTLLDIVLAVLRLIADPVGETRRGWRWLAIKVSISVWIRHLFTLAVSRDLYRGVPAIYVNYLDYDVFAHAYGPRGRPALRALRRIDRSIEQIWRTVRRVPEHGYDLYVLSDHGQMACRPYTEITADGRRLERVLLEDFLGPSGAEVVDNPRAGGRRGLLPDLEALRDRCAPGLFQRFVNYLERDFPALLGELPESRQAHGVRVVAAGPNAFVYFLETDAPATLAWIDRRWPKLADDVSRARGVGLVLVRSDEGPVCIVQGKRVRLRRDDLPSFAARPAVPEAIRDLMAMPSAGDLVIYGNDTPDGNVSYVAEHGAHAGISEDEMETFVVAPRGSGLPDAIGHPIDLYPHFMASRTA